MAGKGVCAKVGARPGDYETLGHSHAVAARAVESGATLEAALGAEGAKNAATYRNADLQDRYASRVSAAFRSLRARREAEHELHRATNKAGREAAKAKIAKLDARGAANLSARNRAFNSFEAHNPGKTLEATGSKTSRVFVSVADRQPTKAAPRTQERNVALYNKLYERAGRAEMKGPSPESKRARDRLVRARALMPAEHVAAANRQRAEKSHAAETKVKAIMRGKGGPAPKPEPVHKGGTFGSLAAMPGRPQAEAYVREAPKGGGHQVVFRDGKGRMTAMAVPTKEGAETIRGIFARGGKGGYDMKAIGDALSASQRQRAQSTPEARRSRFAVIQGGAGAA